MGNSAIDLRPQNLESVIGQESAKKAIKSFISTGNFPNVFLFVGPPGVGKTTLAQIVAREAGGDPTSTHNVNGSDRNGVDDARELAEMSWSVPFLGKRRVFLIDEFQRMTQAAMDCLLEPMEKSSALWLLTSTDPSKISPAIKSRASAATFELKPLTKIQISDLIYGSIPSAHDAAASESAAKFAQWFYDRGITSPREILGVLDQHFAGVPLEQAVHGAEHEPLYKDICGATLRGDWAKTSSLLAQVKTADSRGLVSVLSAFLRGELIKNPIGAKADALAACLVGIDQTGFQDGVAYGAVTGLLYKTAKALSSK